MQEAIKRAIEGGWNKSRTQINPGFAAVNIAETLLDSEFWKCLGKAVGWVNISTRNQIDQLEVVNRWEVEWHKLIDHLAEGKDINSFFNNLLK